MHKEGFAVALSGPATARGGPAASEVGEGAASLAADLSAPGAARALAATVAQNMGRVDGLGNRAAIYAAGDLVEVGEGEIRDAFATNTAAPMNLRIAPARHM